MLHNEEVALKRKVFPVGHLMKTSTDAVSSFLKEAAVCSAQALTVLTFAASLICLTLLLKDGVKMS